MARLIDLPDAGICRSPLALRVGDMLLFRATGGRVRSGDAIELLGSFTEAVLGEDGKIVTPMGPPNAVLFRAHRPGRAIIDVITGDPFHAPRTTELGIHVGS